MKKTKTLLLIITFLFTGILISQELKSKIKCKVLDAISKEPISYATILIKNKGTHADINGFFELPIRFKKSGVMRISSIGYVTKNINTSTLKQDKIITIFLSPSIQNLNEIVISSSKKKKKLTGKGVVWRAIKNIKKNYPTEPYSYIAYYRDYQQSLDNIYNKVTESDKSLDYINLYEGIVEVFDEGFQTNKFLNQKNQTLLYDYKLNTDFHQDSSLVIPYDNQVKKYSKSLKITPFGGNELNILNITNAIRNYNTSSFSFVDILDQDFIDHHEFKIKNIIDFNNTVLYEVTFKSIKYKTSINHSGIGTIYISKSNYAIYKLNYNLYYRFNKKKQYSITIEYVPKGDKMFLNYITFNNFFEVTSIKYLEIEDVIYYQEFKAFKIKFNKSVDLNSLNPIKRNFKLYYKGERLKVEKIKSYHPKNKSLVLFINEVQLESLGMLSRKNNSDFNKNFKIEIKSIKDTDGYEIYKPPTFTMYQFRELFVQEVFEHKELPKNKMFVDKKAPLSSSKITSLKLNKDYWINTPLKTTKKIR